MKKLISLLLCVLLLGSMTVSAFALGYSFKSSTGEKLSFPRKSAYLEEPFQARVLGCDGERDIYIMPKAEAGHGVLGTLANDQVVTILAEYGGFYFFQTEQGYYGWNGAIFFEAIADAEEEAEEPAETALPVSDTGDTLTLPAEDEYYATPRVKMVSMGSPEGKGAIYLMPMPEAGHGNIGTVKDTSTVLVLAEHQGFYFVQTVDGRQGWNGCGWFVD